MHAGFARSDVLANSLVQIAQEPGLNVHSQRIMGNQALEGLERPL